MKKVLLLFIFLPCVFQFSQGQDRSVDSRLFEELKFRSIGPSRGGRVTAVAGVTSRPGMFYMGSTGGGVWKTNDYGITWQNISDRYFESPSIGDINVAPSNPDILYVGTGSDGIRSNVINGKGIYKSEDGGKTWKHSGLKQVGLIGAVEIHPKDPNIVFVAAIGQPFQPNPERGVYRTKNGGETWELVLHHSDTVGAVDIEFAPDDPNTIYAALWRTERKPWTIISGGYQSGGIYKSTDGGDHWNKITAGLPSGLIGKADLAVSAQNPSILYALIEAPGEQGGLYVSENRGQSFELVKNDFNKLLLERPFYYCNVEANPRNARSLFVLAEDLFKSTDGGRNWTRIKALHGDHHDIWINPHDTLTFVEGNDGGTSVTVNGGETWSTQHNQPTAELYQVEVDDQYPYWVYAGQQDNTSIAIPSLPPYPSSGELAYWRIVGGCETGPSVPKPGDHNTVYSNCKGKFGVYNKLTGQEKQYYVGAINMYGHNPKDLKYRFQRVSPIHVSKHNPGVIYHGSQYLHKTTDEGVTWKIISPDLTAFAPETQVISGSPITRDVTGEEFHSTLYVVNESPLKEGVIWTGANDGPVFITLDNGKNWQNVTPSGVSAAGRVSSIEPSPHLESKAYVTILRYQLGDWRPYIYKTADYGRSWKLLSNGNNGISSDNPVRVVREDPDRNGLLYAGTEYGLFLSFDDGDNWLPFQQNLPVTPVTDIKIYRQDLILSTMGRSFWILDDISTLHQLVDLTNEPVHLFKPRDTYRYRYSGNDQGAIPHYPVPGVIIDYYIGEDTAEPVSLEIFNPEKILVRAYSHAYGDTTANKTHSSGMVAVRNAALRQTKGLHRFRWDFRHYGEWNKKEKDRFQNGPLAAPGQYTVRLTVGARYFEETFTLLKDPRLHNVSDNDLITQEALALKVRNLLDTARRLAYQIETDRKEIQRKRSNGGLNKPSLEKENKLKAITDQLVTAEGVYMQPMLIDQLAYLKTMIGVADQKPGNDAYIRYHELKDQLARITANYQSQNKSRAKSTESRKKT